MPFDDETSTANQFADLIAPSLPTNMRLVLWNGRDVSPPAPTTSECVVTFKSPRAARAFLAARNDRQLAEIYITGMIDLSGDASAVFPWLEKHGHLQSQPEGVWRSRRLLWRLPRSATKAIPERFYKRSCDKSRTCTAEIAFHYDKPVQFWELWLDPLLQYTCAYYLSPGDTLERAQCNKLELIFKKLDLGAGDHLLDLGCGWGGLLWYASTTRKSRCTGVTLARSQFEYASRRLSEQIAGGGCRVAHQDLRTLGDGAVHKATAVGVLEHMPSRHVRSFFRSAYRQLVAGGLFLSQAICWASADDRGRVSDFMDTYVFPGGRLLTISEAAAFAESVGFEILDVENLRPHYIETLGQWRQSFEQRRAALVDLVGETTFRVFRLYLAASEHRFRSGKLGVNQMLLRKPGPLQPTRLPGRRVWYCGNDGP